MQNSPFSKDLIATIRSLYEPAGMKVTSAPLPETESSEYGAYRFGLEGHTIVFRIAKTTPTKIGQFVTLWKRPNPGGDLVPLDSNDGVAFVVICVFDETHCGQFVFDQKRLLEKNIMSYNGKGGKRAIRVYPPWTHPVAKEALKSQEWQLQHFLPLMPNEMVDLAEIHKLFTPQGG